MNSTQHLLVEPHPKLKPRRTPQPDRKKDEPRTLLKRGRVAIFIDEANLFNAARILGIKIDYSRLLEHLTAGNQCSGAFLYTAVNSNRHKRHLKAKAGLRSYKIIDRHIIRHKDGTLKANLDVEIATDLVTKAFENTYDTAILVSGDGDFAYAVRQAKAQGRRVEVISLKAMTSRNLVAAADAYLDLASIKQCICQ
ncbi:LabA-like NYN domain-containing protein [Trichothermofontia sp.]